MTGVQTCALPIYIDSFADSDFTWEKFEDAYQNELANDLGNLIQRLATLANVLLSFAILPRHPIKDHKGSSR